MKKWIYILLAMMSFGCLTGCSGNEAGPTSSITENEAELKREAIYKLAVESGFTGTYEEWLASIKGDKIELKISDNKIVWKYVSEDKWYDLVSLEALTGKKGNDGREVEFDNNLTEILWRYKGELEWRKLISIESLKAKDGVDGKSAYELAVDMGFKGTMEEWLSSLAAKDGVDGRKIEINASVSHIQYRYEGDKDWINLIAIDDLKGTDGKSAYEVAVSCGYKGTAEDWVKSLHGKDGVDGREIEFNVTGLVVEWRYKGEEKYKTLVSLESLKGSNGKSAYEIAVELGETRSEQEWLASLEGTDGLSAFEIYKKYHPEYNKTEEEWINDLANGALVNNIHTVSFNTNGGNEVAPVKVCHGYSMVMPRAPERAGYRFDGWYLNGVQWLFDIYTVSKDITLEAKWVLVDTEYTFDEKLIEWNLLPEQNMPEGEYDIYAWAYKANELDGYFVKVNNGKVLLNPVANQLTLVLVAKGEEPSWGNTVLAQTVDLNIVDGKIDFPVKEKPADPDAPTTATYELDYEKLAWNLLEGQAMPEAGTYDTYAYTWLNGDNKFTLVEETGLVLDKNITDFLLVFVTKGSPAPTSFDGILAQTQDLKIVQGNVTYPVNEKPYVPTMVTYALDFEKISWNLKKDNVMPEDGSYDVYAFTWFDGDKFVLVDGTNLELDSRIMAFNIAFVKKGETPDWNSTVLASTENLAITDGVVVYPVNEKPAAPVDVTYALDLKLIEANLQGDATMPEAGTYSMYAYTWKNGEVFTLIEGTDLVLKSDITEFLIVFFPIDAPEPTNFEGKLCQTENLSIVDGKVAYPTTPVDPTYATYELDYTKLAWNLLPKQVMPEAGSYDTYVYTWFEGNNKFESVAEAGLVLDTRITEFLLVFVTKGSPAPTGFEGILAQTKNLTIAEGAVVYPVNEEPVNVTYTLDLTLISYNLQGGATMPEADTYSMYAFTWTNGEVFTLIEGTDLILDSKITEFLIVFFPIDAPEPTSFDGKLCQTVNLKITDGKVVYPVTEKPADPVVETVEYTFDEQLIQWNLVAGQNMPEVEYDIYAWAYKANELEGSFVKVNAGKVLLNKIANQLNLVLVAKGEAPAWNTNILAQTVDLNIVEGKIDFPVKEKPAAPVDVTYTLDLEKVALNMKDGVAVPNEGEYALYAHTWENGLKYTLVEGTNLILPSNITEFVLVFFPIDAPEPTGFDGNLGQTNNLKIVEGKIAYPVNEKPVDPEPTTATYVLDYTKLAWNLLKGQVMPEAGSYDTYVYTWLDGNNKFELVAEAGLVLDTRITEFLLVFVTKGSPAPTSFEGILAQTKNLTIVEGAVVYPVNEEPVNVTYTLDLTLISYNLQGGATMPEADTYSMYAYSWTNGEVFTLIEGTDLILDSKITEFLIVFFPIDAPEPTSFDGKLCQTNNLTIADGKVVYPVTEKPADPVAPTTATYEIDLAMVALNMKAGKAIPAEGTYDLYVFTWFNGDKFELVEGTSLVLDTRITEFLLAFVAKGEAAAWDSNVLAQTNNLKIVEGAISYPVTVAPTTMSIDVDPALVALNLKPNQTMPEAYDMYAWIWGEGVNPHFVKVENNIAALDSKTTGLTIVLMEVGKAADFNGCLAQTVDLSLQEGKIVYPTLVAPTPTPDVTEPKA